MPVYACVSCLCCLKSCLLILLLMLKTGYVASGLSLRYDITPAKFIDMLITEVGCIPSTSVPVILREFQEGKDDVDAELNLELESTS